MRKSDVEALIAQAGGRQSYVAYVFAGDFPPDSSFGWDSSPAGLISSVTNTTGSSVRSININHSAIPFRHRVFVTYYSTVFSTSENDAFGNVWVIDPEPTLNRTTTRICYELTSESVTQ